MCERSIRPADLAQIQLMLDWAAQEGWNPGLDDARLFQRADPRGFFMAYEEQQAVAAISVVKHDEQHGFLGLYICHPEYRGRGHGWALWKAGMDYLAGKVVGLDGVVEQQANYRKSGFELAYRNIRYAGAVAGVPSMARPRRMGGVTNECRSCTTDDWPTLIAMDKDVTGYARQDLLTSWLKEDESRFTLVCVVNGVVRGFGTIRQCLEGFKVGPLIAEQPDQALALLQQLVVRAGAQEIVLDIPEPNDAAVKLAESVGLAPVFETARMYQGMCPDYQLHSLFGVASFELG